jgi:hypothetical protein
MKWLSAFALIATGVSQVTTSQFNNQRTGVRGEVEVDGLLK